MSRRLRMWHRWAGLLVAIFALELSVTGVLLNHTDDLKLDQQPVQSSGLLSWYGIRAPEQIPAYTVGDHWVSQWGQQLYLDDQALPNPPEGELLGAVPVQGLIALAWSERVWLLTNAGQLAMSWDAASDMRRPVQAIASDGERLWLRAGDRLLRSDTALLNWLDDDTAGVPWVSATALPAHLRQAIERHYLGRSLSWERVVLDLHSGHLFGRMGPWLVDAAGVLLALLALSGLWVWWLGRRARRR